MYDSVNKFLSLAAVSPQIKPHNLYIIWYINSINTSIISHFSLYFTPGLQGYNGYNYVRKIYVAYLSNNIHFLYKYKLLVHKSKQTETAAITFQLLSLHVKQHKNLTLSVKTAKYLKKASTSSSYLLNVNKDGRHQMALTNRYLLGFTRILESAISLVVHSSPNLIGVTYKAARLPVHRDG